MEYFCSIKLLNNSGEHLLDFAPREWLKKTVKLETIAF